MKKYFLLTISFIIVTLILSFGQATYNKQISNIKPATNKENYIAPKESSIDTPITKEEDKIENNNSSANETNKIIGDPKPAETIIQNNSSEIESTKATEIPTLSPSPTLINSPTPTETPQSKTVQLKIQGLDSYNIELGKNDNGWDIMRKAADKYAFLLIYKNYGWGIWVKQIGNLAEHDNFYWALYYNGNYSPVGIADIKPQAKDIIEWKMETW